MKNVTLDIVLAERIKSFMKRYQLEEQEQLPSNRELAKMFEVQRLTVTAALNRLVNEGVIYAVPRKGYFVSEKKIVRDLVKFESFSEMAKSKGLEISTKSISVRKKKSSKPISRALDILEGTTVYEIKRLRIYKNKPLALEISFIPEHLTKELENQDLENNSLYDILTRLYGIVLEGASQEITMAMPDREYQNLLEVDSNDALLVLKSIAYTEAGTRIEYSESITRGDRCTFMNVLTREEL
jgi:GntR family transcriptional regulator